MGWLFNAIVCILFQLLGIVINVANAFLTNIAVYEASTGLTFDWSQLLTNNVFWIVVITQFAYGILTICVHLKNRSSDERLKKAIEDEEIVLVSEIGNKVKEGDFDSVKKILKVLDKLRKRRKH